MQRAAGMPACCVPITLADWRWPVPCCSFMKLYPVGTYWSRWLYHHYATVWAKCEQVRQHHHHHHHHHPAWPGTKEECRGVLPHAVTHLSTACVA
jgi:hypothetical protein